MIEPLPDIDYDKLDAGIRETVRFLRNHGFNTTDSGDGDVRCATPHPMVEIRIDNPEHLTMHARRLYRILSMGHDVKFGHDRFEGKDSAPFIEATYDPVLGVATIVLGNVDDELLKLKPEE